MRVKGKSFGKIGVLWASVFIIGLFSFLPSYAQVYQLPETVLYETECHICGKTIKERHEAERDVYFDHMGSWTPIPYDFIPDSLRLRTIEIDKKIEVCPECLSKYGTEINESIEWIWNKRMGEFITENSDKRKRHNKLRHNKELQELEAKIKQLQSQLRGIGGTVEEDRNG